LIPVHEHQPKQIAESNRQTLYQHRDRERDWCSPEVTESMSCFCFSAFFCCHKPQSMQHNWILAL